MEFFTKMLEFMFIKKFSEEQFGFPGSLIPGRKGAYAYQAQTFKSLERSISH